MTRNLLRNAVLCLWIFLSLLLSSCSWLTGEQTQRLTDTAAQAQMELEAGRFQRAIDIYEGFRQKYPQDSAVQSGYVWMLESIKRGDCVITTGGLHGRVFSVEDDDVILDGSYGVNVRITKSFVATVKKD